MCSCELVPALLYKMDNKNLFLLLIYIVNYPLGLLLLLLYLKWDGMNLYYTFTLAYNSSSQFYTKIYLIYVSFI